MVCCKETLKYMFIWCKNMTKFKRLCIAVSSVVTLFLVMHMAKSLMYFTSLQENAPSILSTKWQQDETSVPGNVHQFPSRPPLPHVNTEENRLQNVTRKATTTVAFTTSRSVPTTSKEPLKTNLSQALDDNGKAKPEMKGDVLITTTNTGFQLVVPLNRNRIALEYPFTSYYAELNVVTEPDVASVVIIYYEARKFNFTLGLGTNWLQIILKRANRSVKRHITFDMIRQERTISYVDGPNVQMCYLEQDCDLIMYADRKCGLQVMQDGKVPENSEGYWKLKCNNCSLHETCLWPQAEWVETNGEVTLPILPDGDSLRACFKDHQLLFFGDSTLRGMMQTIMERVNTTLTQGIKSMTSTKYTNIGQHTNFSLTYFNPYVRQETATFDFRLNQLPSKFPISGKENRTILLIGGTQWLTELHVQQLRDFITNLRIPASNVFIKLYTSGFHVTGDFPEGNRKLPPKTMLQLNDAAKQLAIKYEIGFVDPLRLTLSRFKEFHSGQCGCHFHRVNSYMKKSQSTSSPPVQLYSIAGEMDIVYTHMLLKKMCPRTQS